jgi:hypothetical protein
MKSACFLLVILSLFTVVGCGKGAPVQDPATLRSVDPLTCIKNKSTSGCNRKWVVSYPRQNFPEAIEILINGKRVFLECGDLHFTVSRQALTVEILMWDYLAIEEKEKDFFFFFKRVPDCYDLTLNTNFKLVDPQEYTVPTVNGEKIVQIKN